MQKFNESVEKIMQVDLSKIKEEIDKAEVLWSDLYIEARHEKDPVLKKEKQEQAEEFFQEVARLHAKLYALRLRECVYINNAKYALQEEVLPEVLAIFHRYAGKRMGPATRDKIHTEILESLGVYMVMSENKITITHKHERKANITVYTKNGVELLDDNRLNDLAIDDFRLCDFRYYSEEAIDKALDEIESRLDVVNNKFLELKKELDALNDCLLPGIIPLNNIDFRTDKISLEIDQSW